jgi:hypothetical protein
MKRARDFNYISGKKYDGMMSRCYRPNDASFKNFGGRGIRVTKSWILDMNVFRAWLLNELVRINIDIETFVAQSKYYQLDRVNTNGHYTPENCRIVNSQTNARNRRTKVVSKIITAEGEEIEV